MYKLHTHCRACGYAAPGANGIKAEPNDKLIEVFDLGLQPLANDFRKAGEEHAGYAPLKVLFCPQCSLAQLSVVVDPKVLYSNYSYVTSPSETMRKHFELVINDIKAETDGTSVLEIGSNDGRLLATMKAEGYTVQGVDPAENLSAIARAGGIPTVTGFWNSDLAKTLSVHDIIIARHVFCHTDDWTGFVRALDLVTHKDSVVFIEIPDCWDTLNGSEFDQIYHEHLSYMTIRAIKFLLLGSPFELNKVLRYSIHGGAIMLVLHRRDALAVAHASALSDDGRVALDRWTEFAVKAKDQINRLSALVLKLRAQRFTVAAIGASAKSTVWINACGFSRKEITFIADNTPQKQLTFSPGNDIPIVDEGAILRELPSHVILFAWNYREEVLEKFALARSKGVKFIVPVPSIEIV